MHHHNHHDEHTRHKHEHHHHHHNVEGVDGSRLLFAALLNVFISIIQIVGGILSGSISLISDTLHNLSDGVSLWIAYFASKIGIKQSNHQKTFGYKRIEIIAAFVNSTTLVAISLYLIYSAVERFYNPIEIEISMMLYAAVIGLILNLVQVIILHKGQQSNINFKAAYLHLIGDTVSSLLVILGGIAMYLWQLYFIDALLTLFLSFYLIYSSYKIVISSLDILMQSNPLNINLEDLKTEILKFDKIKSIHHIHIWSLDEHQIYFEAHIDFSEDLKISEVDKIRIEIEEFLHHKYEINHITLQSEFDCCNDKNILSAN